MNTLSKRVAAGKSFLSKIAKPAVIVGTSLLISGCNFLNQVGGLSTGEKVVGGVIGAGLIVAAYRGLSAIRRNKLAKEEAYNKQYRGTGYYVGLDFNADHRVTGVDDKKQKT